jgi:hypothetical protein
LKDILKELQYLNEQINSLRETQWKIKTGILGTFPLDIGWAQHGILGTLVGIKLDLKNIERELNKKNSDPNS